MINKKNENYKESKSGLSKYLLFKKMDFILILIMVVLSFIPQIYLWNKDKNTNNIRYLEIQVDGKIFKKIKLTGNTKTYLIDISKDNKKNVVLVDKETVSMKESNCKDQICVHHGKISKNGETIVCLPNRVVLEIKGGSSNDEDVNSF